MRIYDLAKQLGMDSKELIDKLKKLNFPVKSHMSSVDEDTAEIIKHEVEDLKNKEIEENLIEVVFPLTVKDLAVKLNAKPSILLKDLIKGGKFVTINQNLDEKTAKDIAYKYKVNLKEMPSKEDLVLRVKPKKLKKRPPLVTLMGHIDHGKTTILDYIRKSKIADKETGGITQHIGAYQVDTHKGKITFLDTPGHETFTAMRSRGANVTDIVILVIAADEGVKPQTVEAIDHAKAAGVDIIVAINKIDKPNADLDMVKQQLSKVELVPEDWGGKTTTVGVSAKTGAGIDELLDLIILQAEVMELKADYSRPALGMVVEARLSKGKGPLVSILVKDGILKRGDWCVCGLYWGRVKAMYDDRGTLVDEAPPSFPTEILGLNGVSNPGDQIFVVSGEKDAREIVEKRREEERRKRLNPPVHMKLEDLYKKAQESGLKKLKVILKADVGGTLEAIEASLSKIPSDEVEINIVHKGVGVVTSSDVLLAEVSDAIIVGFKVSAEARARDYARSKGVEVRVYHIIYELINDVRAAVEGMLSPQVKKIFTGRAKVKTGFKLSKSGLVAGCVVEKGKINRGDSYNILRNKEVVFEGKIKSLKRFKDDVKEVREGFECGISLGYSDLKEGDTIDTFNEEVITRHL